MSTLENGLKRPIPTSHRPGSFGKVEELAKRYERGQELFDEGDEIIPVARSEFGGGRFRNAGSNMNWFKFFETPVHDFVAGVDYLCPILLKSTIHAACKRHKRTIKVEQFESSITVTVYPLVEPITNSENHGEDISD